MINVKAFENAPKAAGVYIFKKAGIPLYIGKAANLKKRLSSYWRQKSLSGMPFDSLRSLRALRLLTRGQAPALSESKGKNAASKIQSMLQEATRIEWVETESEIEALLKEAELIKRYQPKYNYLLRDDKNYFYVGITKDEFPRIFITHQPHKVKSLKFKVKSYIGPFTSGVALKETLRLLRRVFPYCTCKTPHKRPCLNAQIGRCPGYCCLKQNVHLNKRSLDKVNIREYRKNLENIQTVLGEKKKTMFIKLKQDMRHAAKKQDFERAAKLRDQMVGLENIFAHRRFIEPLQYTAVLKWDTVEKTLQSMLSVKRRISRVEGYDISNISGTEATGSMVVFIDGKSAKSEYRKFKIKTVHGANDVAMLKEVIGRRLQHSEWNYPDLMLIDGGKPQFNAALAALKFKVKSLKSKVPSIAALAKREEELYTEKRITPIRLNTLPRETAFFLQRVRDESHRFAKKYHHKLREKLYRGK